jgi:hypothetical protein
MALSMNIFLCVLAAIAGSPQAARVSVSEGALALAEERSDVHVGREMDLKKLPKIINAGMNLGITLISTLTEADPDIEMAIESLEIQGWQIVTLMIPDEEKDSGAMANARKAWDDAFADIPELVEKIQESWDKSDAQGALEILLEVVDVGLRSAATVAPEEARFINAISDFAKGFGGAVSSFSKEMNLLSSGDSLAQVGDGLGREGWDTAHMNKLLTTSVGLVTTLISALSEDPPDFRYAIDSFKVQGWQLAKLIVPRTEWRSQAFKNAKKAWNEAWANAPVLTEKALAAWNGGNVDQMIDVLVETIQTGLRTAAHVDASRTRELTAVADLVKGVSDSSMKFAHEIGWLGD